MAELVVLDRAPSLPSTFARAALTARGRSGALPTTRLARRAVPVELAAVAGYARVCRFPLTDDVPVTFPHVLAFGLQMALMGDRAFPLALPGLVHVRNRIEQSRPIRIGESLDVEVHAERLAAHRRGTTVELCSVVSAGGEEIWLGRSTYLARGVRAPADAPAAEVDVAVGELPPGVVTWRVPADAGRRYAQVSGDVNPIHLSALSARVFGFPRAIAHGMWVTARAVAALTGRLPGALAVDVAFGKPLLLPSTVTLATAPVDGGWDLAVRGARAGTEHLVGTVRAR